MVHCPRCHWAVRGGAAYCANCGLRLPQVGPARRGPWLVLAGLLVVIWLLAS